MQLFVQFTGVEFPFDTFEEAEHSPSSPLEEEEAAGIGETEQNILDFTADIQKIEADATNVESTVHEALRTRKPNDDDLGGADAGAPERAEQDKRPPSSQSVTPVNQPILPPNPKRPGLKRAVVQLERILPSE